MHAINFDINLRKKRADFPITENIIIILSIVLLLAFAAFRLEASNYLRNTARAQKELETICKLEHEFYKQNGNYGQAEDIGFKLKYPYTGILYSIKTDTIAEGKYSFTAYAREVIGNDAFGDHKAGNEYFCIDETSKIYKGITEIPSQTE